MENIDFQWILRNSARRVLDAFCDADTMPEDRRRIALLIALSSIGVGFLIIFSIAAYVQGNKPLAVLDFITAFLLALNLVDAKRRHFFNFNIIVGILFVSLLYVYLFVSGGIDGTAFVWYYTYPLIACFLLGSQKGGIASVLMLGPVIVTPFIDPDYPNVAHYDLNFIWRFIASYLVVGVFSYLFEQTRESNREELNTINQSLEELVSERTSELVETNKQLHEEIEKRKQAHRTMRLSQEIVVTILDSIDATIYVSDMDTYEILFMNKYMKKVFGRDMTGELCWQVFRGESGPCSHCSNPELMDAKNRPTGVHTWEDLNPISNRWYINYDRAITWIDGRSVRIQIAFDVTEYKDTEAKLRQAQKMESIGTLAGGIAHDFNNLLMVIIGNMELALQDIPKSSPAHSRLNQIYAAGFRAKEIVKQLLSFSRKSNPEFKSTALVSLVEDALKFLRSAIPTTIDIETHIPSDGIFILADPTQIHQVLMNLCTNAYQAMENRSGKITITLARVTLSGHGSVVGSELPAGEYAELKISDTGPGIDPQTISHVFDPYFTTKDVGKGSGMGLAVVHGIVKDHKGAISVDSKPGQGATFSILLPVITEVPVVLHDRPREIPTGNEKILLVDDEALLLNTLEKMLQGLGYAVEAFQHPIEALTVFSKRPHSFDLVITDMTMGRMDGLTLGEKIRAHRAEIPIILCTGHSDIVSPEKAVSMGFAAFLTKPIMIPNLAQAIRGAIDRSNNVRPAPSLSD